MTREQPHFRPRLSLSSCGFTLVEIVVTLFLVALLCIAAFAGMQTLSRMTMGIALRSEAHRHLQAEAERLTSASFESFTASSDQPLTSSFKTTYAPSTQAQFAYPTTGAAGRTVFVRRVVAVDSTSTSRTLRVEVQWTWQGRTSLVSTLLFRSR